MLALLVGVALGCAEPELQGSPFIYGDLGWSDTVNNGVLAVIPTMYLEPLKESAEGEQLVKWEQGDPEPIAGYRVTEASKSLLAYLDDILPAIRKDFGVDSSVDYCFKNGEPSADTALVAQYGSALVGPVHGTAFWVSPTRVATVDHLINEYSCSMESPNQRTLRFIRGYSPDVDTYAASDVFSCSYRADTLPEPCNGFMPCTLPDDYKPTGACPGGHLPCDAVDHPDEDYAVLEMVEPITLGEATVLPVAEGAFRSELSQGQLVRMTGFPMGLSMKLNEGSIQGSLGTDILTDLDIFGGNSGSPVVALVDGAWKVVGIGAYSASDDWVPRPATRSFDARLDETGTCFEFTRCAEYDYDTDDCWGTGATSAEVWSKFL